MDKVMASEKLLNQICEIDNVVNNVMKQEGIKNHVISELSKGFENIVNNFNNLTEDIIRRIINYHSKKYPEAEITDFVHLVDWYSINLSDHPAEYWDATGKYYELRMNEVINLFLIARFNLGAV